MRSVSTIQIAHQSQNVEKVYIDSVFEFQPSQYFSWSKTIIFQILIQYEIFKNSAKGKWSVLSRRFKHHWLNLKKKSNIDQVFDNCPLKKKSFNLTFYDLFVFLWLFIKYFLTCYLEEKKNWNKFFVCPWYEIFYYFYNFWFHIQ